MPKLPDQFSAGSCRRDEDHAFIPPFYLRSATLQTVLASLKLRTMGKNPMVEASSEMILTVEDGVRLQGFYSKQQDGGLSQGLVILLHGWEGSAESTYILHTGKYLFLTDMTCSG